MKHARSTPSPAQKENEMWQPIETAPRDATAILVMRDIWPGTRSGRAEECNGHNTYVAAWWSDERGGQGAWICYMNAVLDPECPVEPTHWMPLPDPPGAQPTPSVPDATWLPVPDKHPTFDPVDLQLADGSVLCGCVPQSDGDYWWEGPSGEVFIDPRYAPVTHWRLSAAPEAKP